MFLRDHTDIKYRDLVRKLPRSGLGEEDTTREEESNEQLMEKKKRTRRAEKYKKESDEECVGGGEAVQKDKEWGTLKRMPLRKSERKPRKASRLIEEDEGEG